MICPTCGYDNLPGNEECSNCLQDLTQIDRPAPNNRVERSLMEDKVSLLQPKAPATILPTTTVGDAIKTMLNGNFGALLVVDKAQKLVGVFSERDLLTKVAGIENYGARPVSDFMTPNPESVGLTDTLDFVLHKMDGGGYRHLPVVQDGKPVGVISVRDMLKHITKLCKDG